MATKTAAKTAAKTAPKTTSKTTPRPRGKDTVETRNSLVVRVHKTTRERIREMSETERRSDIDTLDLLIDAGLKSLGKPGLPLPDGRTPGVLTETAQAE